jgi:acyl-CoA dehydrogenase
MTITHEPTTLTATAGATPPGVGPTTAPPPGWSHWTGVDPSGRWPTAANELVGPLASRAAEHDRDGTFVHDGIDLLRERGLLAMLVPEAVGGGGASHAEACAVLSVLAHGCPATALTLSMHTHLVAAQVWRHRRDLPAPVLARVANERIVLVSTGASDWIDSSGTAVRVDGGYRVTGRKTPASGGPAGDVLVTSVRWEDGPDGPQVLHASVPFTAAGVSVDDTWDTMGMRGTGSHTVVLDDVFVPDAAVSLTRPAGVWHPVWSTVLGAALPLIMAAYVGVAEAAADRAIGLALRRAERSDIAPLVGRMLNRLTAARDAVHAMIAASDDLRFDNTLDHAAASLTRKTIAADAVIDTVRLAMEVGGGAAYSVAGGVERLFRDVHGALYHPLPAARQERFTGRMALGLAPLGSTPGNG